MKNIFKSIKLAGNKLIFAAKAKAPEICVTAGIAVGLYGLYSACKATLEVESIVDEAKETLEKIHENEPKEGEEPKKYEDENGEEKPYTKEIATKNKFTVYIRTAAKLARNYAKSSICIIVSILLILKGFGILKKRHVALTAAYAGLQESYNKYRDTIKKKFGKDIDKETIFGLTEKVITKEKEDEKGNRTVEEEVMKKAAKNPGDDSDYIRLFSNESSRYWKRNGEMNYAFLKSTEVYATTLLRTRGHLFLNEVYDALGMPRTQTGALCGWVLNSTGDNYVSFGINDYYDDKNGVLLSDALLNDCGGNAADFWLEFNCMGTIFDKAFNK